MIYVSPFVASSFTARYLNFGPQVSSEGKCGICARSQNGANASAISVLAYSWSEINFSLESDLATADNGAAPSGLDGSFHLASISLGPAWKPSGLEFVGESALGNDAHIG